MAPKRWPCWPALAASAGAQMDKLVQDGTDELASFPGFLGGMLHHVVQLAAVGCQAFRGACQLLRSGGDLLHCGGLLLDRGGYHLVGLGQTGGFLTYQLADQAEGFHEVVRVGVYCAHHREGIHQGNGQVAHKGRLIV